MLCFSNAPKTHLGYNNRILKVFEGVLILATINLDSYLTHHFRAWSFSRAAPTKTADRPMKYTTSRKSITPRLIDL